MKLPSASPRRAFTLIELLVVISIIAILMTLLFPAVGAALNAAKKAQAKNDATQLGNAINNYLSEYGKLPIANGGGGSDNANGDELMNTLCPPNPSSPPDLNPRAITFIEIPKATKDGRNGRVAGNGPYMDPWGKAYFIKLDDDYDGITQGPTGSSTSGDIRKSVLVWSKGDPKRTTDFSNPEKWIKSWE